MTHASDRDDASDELTQESLLRVLDSLKRSLDQSVEPVGLPQGAVAAPLPPPVSSAPAPVESPAEVPLLQDIVLPGDELDEELELGVADEGESGSEEYGHHGSLVPAGHWIDYLASRLRVELAEEIDAIVRDALKAATPRIEACIRKRVEKMLPVIVADALRRSRDNSV